MKSFSKESFFEIDRFGKEDLFIQKYSFYKGKDKGKQWEYRTNFVKVRK